MNHAGGAATFPWNSPWNGSMAITVYYCVEPPNPVLRKNSIF